MARVTQSLMLIEGQYGRALIYSQGKDKLTNHTVHLLLDQINQLANEIANNSKLSDLTPISLVPQVNLNFDEIKKHVENVEIKVK